MSDKERIKGKGKEIFKDVIIIKRITRYLIKKNKTNHDDVYEKVVKLVHKKRN